MALTVPKFPDLVKVLSGLFSRPIYVKNYKSSVEFRMAFPHRSPDNKGKL